MKCSICGSENNGTKFCTSCGARLYEEDNTAAVITGDTETVPDKPETADVTPDIDEAEASAAQAAADLDSTASEAFHTMAGLDGSESTDTDSDTASSGSYGADTQDSSNYYDAGFKGGDTYSDTYTEGGGYIGFSIASLVCGILSAVCCICGCMNLPLSIAAIVLGIITITRNYDGRGMAIAGLITGGLGLVLGIIMTSVMMADGDMQRSFEEIFEL